MTNQAQLEFASRCKNEAAAALSGIEGDLKNIQETAGKADKEVRHFCSALDSAAEALSLGPMDALPTDGGDLCL